MRLICLFLLLLLIGCQKEMVRQRPPTSTELSQVLGLIQTLEITPPKGARSFAMSHGGAGNLTDFVKQGQLNITVALLSNKCPDDQSQLSISVGGIQSGLCLALSRSYSTGLAPQKKGEPIPLNRWVPIYTVRPSVPGKTKGSETMDENPAHWTLVSVYFSDQANIEKLKLPEATEAIELLR